MNKKDFYHGIELLIDAIRNEEIPGGLPFVFSVNDETGHVTITPKNIGAVPIEATVNGKTLSAPITLTAEDVKALSTDKANQAITSSVNTWLRLNTTGEETEAGLSLQRGGKNRWSLWMTNQAEGSSNEGSNLLLRCFSNDGVNLGNVMMVSRATLTVDFAKGPTVSGMEVFHPGNLPTLGVLGADGRLTVAIGEDKAPLPLSQRFGQLQTVLDHKAKGDGSEDDTEAVQGQAKRRDPVAVCAVTVEPEQIDSRNLADTLLTTSNGKVIDFPQGFLGETVTKITSGQTYTAWAQDSAYTLGNQIRIWGTQKDSHADFNGMPVCMYSDDNGASFSVAVMDETLNRHSVWSAGIAHGREYVFIREDVEGGFKHYQYSRPAPEGHQAEYFGNWEVMEIPATAWLSPYDNQPPIMIHSFAEDAEGFIVGAHNGSGAWLVKVSTEGEAVVIPLSAGTNAEEPTVKFHKGHYFGFIRAGNAGTNPKFWKSLDGLKNISVFTAPADTFGANKLSDCPVSLNIDSSGVIHAFVAFRSGSEEGRPTDAPTSMFYLTAPIEGVGSFWAKAKNYRLGVLRHEEKGGASALGVGAVVVHHNNVQIYTGSEGRTGSQHTRDRVTDLYQITIPLKKSWGAFDYRERVARVGVAPAQFHKLAGKDRSGYRAETLVIHGEVLTEAYKKSAEAREAKGLLASIVNGGKTAGFNVASDSGYASFCGYFPASVGPSGMLVRHDLLTFKLDGKDTVVLSGGAAPALRPSAAGGAALGSSSRPWSGLFVEGEVYSLTGKRSRKVKALDEVMVDALCQIARNIGTDGVTAEGVHAVLAEVVPDPLAYGFLSKQGAKLALSHSQLQYAIAWAQQMRLDRLSCALNT